MPRVSSTSRRLERLPLARRIVGSSGSFCLSQSDGVDLFESEVVSSGGGVTGTSDTFDEQGNVGVPPTEPDEMAVVSRNP